MYLSTLALNLLLFGSALAIPTNPSWSYAVKERHPVPRGWTAVSQPPSSHKINLHIGLKHQNQDKLEQHVLELSDPSHARYGQYMSASDIRDLIAPPAETVDMIRGWLLEHKISEAALSPTRDSFTVVLPVEKVEELLATTYSVFRHDDGTTLVRAPEWSLPEYLHEYIDVVQPTNSFFRPRKQATTHEALKDIVTLDEATAWGPWHGPGAPVPPGASCNVSVVCNVTGTNLAGATINVTTLECLRCLYGTIDYTPQVPDKNMIGVCNYLNETQVRSDIQQYLDMYRPEAAAVAYEFPIVVVANGQDDQVLSADQLANEQDIEGDLDGELVLGISWPTSFMSWVTGGEPPIDYDLYTTEDTNEPYLTWLDYVLAQDTLPQVITTSYGDDEQTIPFSYAVKVCDGFKQLAAQGISVIFSSGDSGVGPTGYCYSNTDPSKYMFLPAFPASCPWVTAVGATKSYLPEVVVTRYGSGAGFSNYFGQPSYQTSAVEGYLAKIGDLYAGLYNRSGRGYPDVAAQGDHDQIVWAGNVTTVGGTSASAPAFAAIIALVNDVLIAAGRPPLGFLNPWIYGGAYTALTDITIGSSIGCNTTGFPAEIGWDPATGFGTPNFDKLVAAALHPWQGK